MPEERIIPGEAEEEEYWDHVSRYRFACGFVRGAEVLDVATGVGYGADMLLREGKAGSVTGVDNSSEAIEFALSHYASAALRFVVADASHMPFEDGSFDTVVSLETLEHLRGYQGYIEEVSRVLRDSGTLIISTPNKRYDSKNPFHLSRVSVAEFHGLLVPRFTVVECYGQEHLSRSASFIARVNRVLGYITPQPALDALYRLKLRAVRGGRSQKGDIVRTADLVHCRRLVAVCRKKNTRS